MRSAMWRCKKCGKGGVGGPDGWLEHDKQHNVYANLDAQISFGFAPNYSSGWRTSHWTDYRPAPRADVDEP